MTSYIICCTPRTASTYLYQVLYSCEAGHPWEWFSSWHHPPDGMDVEEYWRTVVKPQHRGAKVFWNHLTEFPGLSPRRAAEIWSESKVIYLYRNDKVAQAVSASLAYQTGQFQSWEEKIREPVYNPNQIRGWLEKLEYDCYCWREWLGHYRADPGKEPYIVQMEQLIADPEKACRGIFEFLEAPWTGLPWVEERKIGNPLKEEWITLFKKERDK